MCSIVDNTHHTWPVPPAHSSNFWMHCDQVCANTAITLLTLLTPKSTATRKLWRAPNKHMYENTTKCSTHEGYCSWVYHHSNLTCDSEKPYSQKLSETQPRMYMISIHQKTISRGKGGAECASNSIIINMTPGWAYIENWSELKFFFTFLSYITTWGELDHTQHWWAYSLLCGLASLLLVLREIYSMERSRPSVW